MTRLMLAPLAAILAAGALAAPASAQSFPDTLPGPLGQPLTLPLGLKPVPDIQPQIRLTDCRKYWVYNKEDGSYSLQEVCFGYEVIKP
jgi:hypothetical protein